MTVGLDIFCALKFDGRIYVKCHGLNAEISIINYLLFKDNLFFKEVESHNQHEQMCFENCPPGIYKAYAKITVNTNTTKESESIEITAKKYDLLGITTQSRAGTKNLKGGHNLYNNVKKHYLEIKFSPRGLEKLKQEPTQALPLYTAHKARMEFHLVFTSDTLKKAAFQSLSDFYKVNSSLSRNDLVLLAEELEALDYVVYCSVTPDLTNMSPPTLPLGKKSASPLKGVSVSKDSATPDFSVLQTYLNDSGFGMNIRAAWSEGVTGKGVTVRLIDFGVYSNHEDLQHNITVESSRPETEDCSHGTATTGCIAASNNGTGVTGIAYDCDFHFYDTGDFDTLVSHSTASDIVLVNIQLGNANGDLVPLIDNKAYWDKFYTMVNQKAVVIMAAGNGWLDLGAPGVINDYGDCGGMLCGASSRSSGRIVEYVSNYGHPELLVNSWGDWSVTTTGWTGDLQSFPGNDRNYTSSYSGTSAGTPLVSGSLALIQSYIKTTYGVFLDAFEMREVMRQTGYADALEDQIGFRPNVYGAITYLKEVIKSNPT